MPEILDQPQSPFVEEREMATMGLLQHLEELRKRIMMSAAAVAIAFGVCWYRWEDIYRLMRKPIEEALAAHKLPTELTFLNPTDPFNLSVKLALITGIFITCPFLLYQVWMFISPGLYRREKRFVLPFLLLSVSLFVGGGWFGYQDRFPSRPGVFDRDRNGCRHAPDDYHHRVHQSVPYHPAWSGADF